MACFALLYENTTSERFLMVFDFIYDIGRFRGPCLDSSMYRPRYKDINYRPRCKHFEILEEIAYADCLFSYSDWTLYDYVEGTV